MSERLLNILAQNQEDQLGGMGTCSISHQKEGEKLYKNAHLNIFKVIRIKPRIPHFPIIL